MIIVTLRTNLELETFCFFLVYCKVPLAEVRRWGQLEYNNHKLLYK